MSFFNKIDSLRGWVWPLALGKQSLDPVPAGKVIEVNSTDAKYSSSFQGSLSKKRKPSTESLRSTPRTSFGIAKRLRILKFEELFLAPGNEVSKEQRLESTVLGLPEGLAFGLSFEQHTVETMSSILFAAKADQIMPGALFIDLYDHNGKPTTHFSKIRNGRSKEGDEQGKSFASREVMGLVLIKYHLWLDLLSLESTIHPYEKEDLARLARDLKNSNSQESALFQDRIRQYLQLSRTNYWNRVPFYYTWFESMGHLKTVYKDNEYVLKQQKYSGYPLSYDPFKIFGRTWQESSHGGLRLIYDATNSYRTESCTNAQEMSEHELWVSILDTFRDCEVKGAKFNIESFEKLSSMIYTMKDLNVKNFSQEIESWNAHLQRTSLPKYVDFMESPYYDFSFVDFMEYLGLEEQDPYVGEFGVLVARSSQIPHSSYEPEVACNSCLETLPRDQFLIWKVTSVCTPEIHQPKTCLSCLNDCVAAQIDDDHVLCPDCREPVSYEDVEQWCSPQTFKRYDESLLRHWKARESTFIECVSCQVGQVHEGSGLLMTCAHCNFQMCIRHMIAWHTGESCEEYDARHTEKTINDQLSQDFMDRQVKKCPQCHIPVEKNGGCFHFTCAPRRGGCGYGFCWTCMEKWSSLHRCKGQRS